MDSKFSTEEKNLNDPLLEFARVPHRVTLFPEHFSRYSIFLFLSHFFPSSSFFFPPPPSPFPSSRTGLRQNGEGGKGEGGGGRENKKKIKKNWIIVSDRIYSFSSGNNYQKVGAFTPGSV